MPSVQRYTDLQSFSNSNKPSNLKNLKKITEQPEREAQSDPISPFRFNSYSSLSLSSLTQSSRNSSFENLNSFDLDKTQSVWARTRFNEIPRQLDPVIYSSKLKPGAKFEGFQFYKTSKFEFEVEFAHVNLNQSFLNGYITIKNLTEENPEITTFFEAEIVSEKHNFLSRRVTPELELNDEVDLLVWSKFPNWNDEILPKVMDKLSKNDFDDISKGLKSKKSNLYVHKNFLSQRYVYMRWKELFLVPDATKILENASYEGIYYVCLDQVTGNLVGHYFHKRYQDQFFKLTHVSNDNGATDVYDIV